MVCNSALSFVSCCETLYVVIPAGSVSRHAVSILSLGACYDLYGRTKVKKDLGSGCSTVVEHAPRNQEVVSLNPPGCWADSHLTNSQLDNPTPHIESGEEEQFIH